MKQTSGYPNFKSVGIFLTHSHAGCHILGLQKTTLEIPNYSNSHTYLLTS